MFRPLPPLAQYSSDLTIHAAKSEEVAPSIEIDLPERERPVAEMHQRFLKEAAATKDIFRAKAEEKRAKFRAEVAKRSRALEKEIEDEFREIKQGLAADEEDWQLRIEIKNSAINAEYGL